MDPVLVVSRKDVKIVPEIVAELAENGHKFACKLQVDFGPMDIGHYSVQIPMFFPEPNPNLDHLEEAEEMLRALTKEAKMWIPKAHLYGPHNIIQTSILAAMYIHQVQDCRSHYILVPAAVLLTACYLNDEVGQLEFNTVVETNNLMARWTEVLMNIWQGKYDTYEQVPAVPVVVESVLRLLFLLKDNFGNLLPPEAKSTYLRAAFERFSSSAIAMRIAAVNQNSTGELYRRLRGLDMGHSVIVETIALGVDKKENQLAPSVRKHILFQLLMDLISLEGGLLNDLFSVEKDLADENELEAFKNHVIRAVKMDGMTYPDAFAYTAAIISNARQDITLLMEELVKEFPEDDNFVDMVPAVKRLMNSYMYVSKIELTKRGALIKII